jgi:hypothetical protein
MLRRQEFLRWQRDVHVYAHWYRRQHDLSRITLSDSHVPDVGEHGERNRAMFVKILDLVGVCVNRIGKNHSKHIRFLDASILRGNSNRQAVLNLVCFGARE